MKEHPILFSSPMVKAILSGTKNQTRRIIKKQPHSAGEWIMQGINWLFPNVNPYINLKCPYGQIGDVLWVRETWIDLQKTPVVGAGSEKYSGLKYWYRADNTREMEIAGRYKPSIFMPKEACRIKLEITNIRVERLQSISEEDAIAEGIESNEKGIYKDYLTGEFYKHPKESYLTLWAKINGKDSWSKNPWVWVIEFKVKEVLIK